MEYVIVNRAEKTILCEGGTFERKRVGDHFRPLYRDGWYKIWKPLGVPVAFSTRERAEWMTIPQGCEIVKYDINRGVLL